MFESYAILLKQPNIPSTLLQHSKHTAFIVSTFTSESMYHGITNFGFMKNHEKHVQTTARLHGMS